MLWCGRENQKIKAKGGLTEGKGKQIKRNLYGTVAGRCAPRRGCLLRPEERRLQESEDELTRGSEWGFWQGGDGVFGRVGESKRPYSWNGKPRAVTVLGSSPGARGKLSESR